MINQFKSPNSMKSPGSHITITIQPENQSYKPNILS